ncbi:GNAT family N-acetyltransferase ['Paenibacillus yunnanensis' Narsing Rao et al. 2020]|uniref:GNAT family N-acetyltransferase n=1 Tax=Paenibacillus tengchongensis TaxID=2608684 RepID=UPI00124D278F|nr:GNAT family N-acetyltransferase [Paenibacillus tengchongensis]
MNELVIECCTLDDLDLLAALNKQLIEDEQHDNPLNVAGLKERMRGFLETDYRAYKFMAGPAVAGYALVNHSRKPLYLRQFFIGRDSRRNGYGRQAFTKLLEVLNAEAIEVDVLSCNERGRLFWTALGFRERSICMRLSETDKYRTSNGKCPQNTPKIEL